MVTENSNVIKLEFVDNMLNLFIQSQKALSVAIVNTNTNEAKLNKTVSWWKIKKLWM